MKKFWLENGEDVMVGVLTITSLATFYFAVWIFA